MTKGTRIYFQIFQHSISDAIEHVRELTSWDLTTGDSSYYGGLYGRYTCDDFHFSLFTNQHDTGAGFGPEYHRPEFPDYEIMLWIDVSTKSGFFDLQNALADPKIALYPTGFEQNWPGPFWSVGPDGLVKGVPVFSPDVTPIQ